MNTTAHNYNNMLKLRPRHFEIIRLFFMGMKQKDIAAKIGMSAVAVGCILNSPMARAELARLQSETSQQLTSEASAAAIMQASLLAAQEAVQINRDLMNSEMTDPKLKARIGMHFLDRAVFGKLEQDAQEASYREILRSLNARDREAPKPLVIDVNANGK